MPGDHCDIPPKSGWLNCAMVPPPERSACRIVRTASAETEWRIETREMNPSSFSGMVAILGCPQLFVNLDVCSQQKRHARYRIYRTTHPSGGTLERVADYLQNASNYGGRRRLWKRCFVMVDRDSAPDHSSFGVVHAPLMCGDLDRRRMYACLNRSKG
jgi:hypothetical protein